MTHEQILQGLYDAIKYWGKDLPDQIDSDTKIRDISSEPMIWKAILGVFAENAGIPIERFSSLTSSFDQYLELTLYTIVNKINKCMNHTGPP